MKNNKMCSVCKEFSGKRKVCKNCKDNFPYNPSAKKAKPFDRKKKQKELN